MDLRQAKDLEEAELNIDGAYKLERTLGVMLGCIQYTVSHPNARTARFCGSKEDGIVNYYHYCCNVILYDDILGGMGLVVDYIFIYFWMLDIWRYGGPSISPGQWHWHPGIATRSEGVRCCQAACAAYNE